MTPTVPAPLKLVAGRGQDMLAMDLAREMNSSLVPVELAPFADGEIRVRLLADVRDATVVILQSTCPPVNDNLMSLALLADAARAAGAIHVIALVPYFGYARQDRRDREGDPRSAQVAAKLLAAVGVDHLVTLDLHAPALESALPMPTTLLRADDILIPLITSWNLENVTIVAPDAGALKRAQSIVKIMAARVAVVVKERPRPDHAEAGHMLGDVRDSTCVIVDDMASTGRTLVGAADVLLRAGARQIHAFFTHAVFAPDAVERILAAPFTRLATSDSVPFASHPRLEVARIAPLLAQNVRRLCGLERPAISRTNS